MLQSTKFIRKYMHLSLPSFPSTSNATAILLYYLTACFAIVTFPLFANLSAEITILFLLDFPCQKFYNVPGAKASITILPSNFRATDHGFCILFSTCRNTEDVWVFLVDQLAEISITSRNDRSIDAFSLFSAISHAATISVSSTST